MKTKAPKTIKWVSSNISYGRRFFKALAFALLSLVIGTISFFGVNTATVAISVGLLTLMLFAIQEANCSTSVEDEINSELENSKAVQASEGVPILTYDRENNLESATLANTKYCDPKSYSNFGSNVYLANFETENGWLIIVIEGEPHSKNQRAVAFRSLSEDK